MRTFQNGGEKIFSFFNITQLWQLGMNLVTLNPFISVKTEFLTSMLIIFLGGVKIAL